MATEPATAERQQEADRPALARVRSRNGPGHRSPLHPMWEPTAGMVLHRVLAMAARTFLLNDMGDELPDETMRDATVAALALRMGIRPLWAQSTAGAFSGTEHRHDEVERIHQCRVALRRVRSNLRTFRLAVDPKWNTALRGECAWYADLLGGGRDLHIVRDVVTKSGPAVIAADDIGELTRVIDERIAAVVSQIAAERAKPRRFQLTEQMMVLWDGPEFRPKAKRPATEVLPPMLQRAWTDLRGAARAARKDPADANLHRLRIRMKALRYGCETMALVEGGAAEKTAKACEQTTEGLGALHDAVFSIDYLRALGDERSDLAEPVAALIGCQREVAARCRKGWKKDLKEVERRWRDWRRTS